MTEQEALDKLERNGFQVWISAKRQGMVFAGRKATDVLKAARLRKQVGDE